MEQPFSLDDAAALLVQLEPGDRREIDRLRLALEDLAFEGGLPPMPQARVAGAARKLRETAGADGEIAAAAAFVEAGRLLEEAMGVASGFAVAAPARVPAAPEASGPPSASVAAADPSLLADFIAESREYMEAAEASLLELEINPGNAEAINTVFRAFHSIKGTSGFLGLEPISVLAHHAESLFNRFRDGEIRCTGPRADLSLRSVDMLGALLHAVERLAAGQRYAEPEGYAELMAVLADPDAAGVLDDQEAAPPRLGDLLVAAGKADREKVEAIVERKPKEERLGLALVRGRAASLTDVGQALRKQRAAAAESSPASVRVPTDRLDRLIDMVGELAVAQAMVAQDEGILADAHGEIARKVSHVGKLVRDLQELSVSLCTVPLRGSFQKMARLVRDAARRSGKQVEFVTEGEETVVDRTLAEGIGDPLVHMIRNAVDHGIERPEVRTAAGKPATGTVRLSAYHAGGDVVVELQDDGRGLDRDRILRRAIDQGLVDLEVGLSDAEIFHLIFAPGFSTADQVTDLSGRGVGMDVVRRNVEALRGRVDIRSDPGRGVIFTIRLPLTPARTGGAEPAGAAGRMAD